jgi:hypothetical protein
MHATVRGSDLQRVRERFYAPAQPLHLYYLINFTGHTPQLHSCSRRL